MNYDKTNSGEHKCNRFSRYFVMFIAYCINNYLIFLFFFKIFQVSWWRVWVDNAIECFLLLFTFVCNECQKSCAKKLCNARLYKQLVLYWAVDEKKHALSITHTLVRDVASVSPLLDLYHFQQREKTQMLGSSGQKLSIEK